MLVTASLVGGAVQAFANGLPDNTSKTTHEQKRESIFGGDTRNLSTSHFTWGVEAGSSIDMTGNDMSTLDANAFFGFKNSFIHTLGAGVGINHGFGTGDNFIPIYFMLNTSFRKKPSLCFLNFKAGYSFSTLDAEHLGSTNASLGVGFNLARARNYRSYITLSYAFRHFNKSDVERIRINDQNVSMAIISFGISF